MRPLVLALLPLAACTQVERALLAPDPYASGGGAVVTRGLEPRFAQRSDGSIAANACLSGRPSGYGTIPSACVLDSVLAAQVAHPQDLVQPRAPGRPYAGPTARAAYEYIYGGLPSDPSAAGPDPGVLIPVPPGAGGAAGGGGVAQ